MKFSVIIPTYNRSDLLETCLKSLEKHEPNRTNYEIIVVDDAGNDWGLIENLRKKYRFRLIRLPANVGFPRAVNAGAKYAEGETLILCNNDIVFVEPILEKFENSFKNDIAVVGCLLYYENGSVQHGGVEYENGYFVHTNDFDKFNKPRFTTAVTFALCAIDREYWDFYGDLNERFFIACDDAEYCMRVWFNDYKVYYNPAIRAIHAEGATRGRSKDEKMAKNPKCLLEEQKSIKILGEYVGIYDIKEIKNKVLMENLNTEENLKLEIGCGTNPQPGYLHLDIRALRGVDVICDFANEKLPFKANTFVEILSSHSIEHISFRKLPFVFQEWHRVLKPGGRVVLRTPDLEFICKSYLEHKTTPEWPDDERFITENFGRVTPAWWANLKLFAGQDYSSNFHFLCFDFSMLSEALFRYGFTQVKRVNLGREISPGELQVEAFKG